MNKKEFVDILKEKGITDTKTLDTVISTIQEVTQKDKLTLKGFGRFERVTIKGKSGTIPGTNKKYTSKGREILKFYAVKEK